MSAVTAFCEGRINLARNSIRALRDEPRLKMAVIIFSALFFFIGGYALFNYGFGYVKNIPSVGVFLMDRLLNLFFMALFCMLIFSNLIVSFSTFYRQKELDFLMSLPFSFTHIFVSKFIETLIYSSWPFILLSLPFLMGYGGVMGYDWRFYLFTFILFPPFLIIPLALGCILTMTLARVFPIRRSFVLVTAILILVIPAFVFLVRFMTLGRIDSPDMDIFALMNKILTSLKFTQFPFLPNHWVMQGLSASARGNPASGVFYLLVLWTNALMAVQVTIFLASRIYYPGWVMFKDSTSRSKSVPGFNWVNRLEKVFSIFMRRPTSSLITKDILVFLRDPSQWIQFTIFFGLLAIYISNLRNMSYHKLAEPGKNLIAFLNLISTCFVLSSLTTRFVFPLFSLEGRRFWAIGLAPLKANRLLLEKYWLSVTSSLLITESLMFFSNMMLGASREMFFLSCGTVFLMSFALPGIAVGLGTVYPDFKEENPARIVSGLGGTICIIASLVYVSAVIALQALPVYIYAVNPYLGPEIFRLMLIAAGILVFFVSLAFAFLPMYFGYRCLKRMEF